MQEILRFGGSFGYIVLSYFVGFLRRLHNFASHVRGVLETDDDQRRKRQVIEVLGSNLESVPYLTTSKTTRDTTGTGVSFGTGFGTGKGVLPLPLLTSWLASTKSSLANVIQIGPKSAHGNLIAKWTTDASEVELIKSLQSATHAQFRNSVIWVIDDLSHGTIGTFLCMPRYTPLDSLHHITSKNHRIIHLQVIEGVAFLHAHQVAHRDLKPANIVVDLERGSSVVRTYIIDFGIARRCTPEYRCNGFQGTRGWTAPEVRGGVDWEPMSADVRAMAKTLKHLANLAGVPHQDMSDVVACHEPASRPTASDLFSTLYHGQSRLAKRPNRASAELPHSKVRVTTDMML
ncbi:hypothetical protein FRB93_010868 [Tulasnella sp. JGI-2019a]|nr:hypothetical protein FRB93_010868 [Tulasnella sp. JGI-2019a]